MTNELTRGATGDVSPAIQWSLMELIREVFSHDRMPTAPGRDTRFASFAKFVADNLVDHRLTPEFMATTFGVSLRYVYSVFAENGASPATYIRNARLELARTRLSQPSSGQDTIASIAHRCGFQDSATFTRAYRRRFDCSPRQDVMRLAGVSSRVVRENCR
ncbi:helix-turn-helix domain-containing protein [Rhodococcus sp. BP-252]|nr:helix-turn-helix domain-containing protein [Rhodococcus sp. BP-320]MBY6417644.1 helix-turn-helix domain-containing protein [Rhodococcus sp. BP-321]MBY6423496.1 helix-turn-helix domain-containing protein [Rhodococcus sp. BP-324]MBY6427668.1 helix-turn-helix domain-containing protein [Rhodococcus sp. BP-323]MBY6432832.1 helix-turn-helix domain-containing protein [Rhodococcus sp. BP-322]MBY6441552.1 helix-turn-helix domain-containing protein [Rhodococcus sp. BP-319]MBY6446626.1 helix-turn-hel